MVGKITKTYCSMKGLPINIANDYLISKNNFKSANNFKKNH